MLLENNQLRGGKSNSASHQDASLDYAVDYVPTKANLDVFYLF